MDGGSVFLVIDSVQSSLSPAGEIYRPPYQVSSDVNMCARSV